MGEACGNCAGGRAIPGTRAKKVQRNQFCIILGEPPNMESPPHFAAPYIRWCERERLAAAPTRLFLSSSFCNDADRRSDKLMLGPDSIFKKAHITKVHEFRVVDVDHERWRIGSDLRAV